MGLKIGRFLGGVAKVATSFIPGPAGAIARGVVGSLTSRPSAPPGTTMLVPGGVPTLFGGGGSAPAFGPGSQLPARISPMGTVGVCPTDIVYTKSGQVRRYRLKKGGGCTWHKRPTMNAGNARAAGRAITRIKAARRLLQRIESALPRRKALSGKKRSCGCK